MCIPYYYYVQQLQECTYSHVGQLLLTLMFNGLPILCINHFSLRVCVTIIMVTTYNDSLPPSPLLSSYILHTCTYTHMQACTRTRTCTHTHTLCARTHTHTHTHTLGFAVMTHCKHQNMKQCHTQYLGIHTHTHSRMSNKLQIILTVGRYMYM